MATQPAWTEGPWRFLDIGTVETDDGAIIAECVDEKNGELIAAAPDLYETLEWVRVNYSSSEPYEVDRRIEAALSKARGYA